MTPLEALNIIKKNKGEAFCLAYKEPLDVIETDIKDHETLKREYEFLREHYNELLHEYNSLKGQKHETIKSI